MLFENWIIEHIQRKHLSVVDVIANLPTKRTGWGQDADELFDDWMQGVQVAIEARCLFIFFADVVGR